MGKGLSIVSPVCMYLYLCMYEHCVLMIQASRQKDRGVLYVGRLPDDFHDEQLRSFFSQFGKVTRVRMSKSQV